MFLYVFFFGQLRSSHLHFVRVHVLSLPARGQELQVAAEDVSAVEVRANS